MPLDVTSDAWKKTWQVAAVHTLACILPRCWAPRAPILAPPRGTCEGTPPLAPRERRGQRMMEVRRVAKRAAEAPSALRCACAARVLGRLLRAGPRACAGGACRGTEGWGGEEASQRETCGGAAEQVSCAARQPGGCSSSAVVFAGPNQRASGTSRPSSGAQHDFLRHTRPWEQAERTRAGVVWPVGGEISGRPRLPECPCPPPRCTLLALAAHPAPRTAAGSYRQPRGGATTRRIAAIAPGASQQVPFQGLAPRCCLRAPARALGRCWRPQVRLSSPYGMFHRRFQPSGGAAAPAAQERKRAADVFRLEKQRRGRRAARALRRGERLAVGAWGCVLVQVLLSRMCGLRCE